MSSWPQPRRSRRAAPAKVALEKLGGATMHSLQVAMKPGKHIAVASLGEQHVPADSRRSPLPATIPSAAVGAVPYIQSGEARNHALMRCGSGWTRLD
ncbi:MAG TPA: hypothetical protein DHU96_26890 [Actinobacteria bacterium]|nr:hypothetical protein [Actinomycetota bacterium]